MRSAERGPKSDRPGVVPGDLKHLAVDEDKTLQQLGVEALEMLLRARASPWPSRGGLPGPREGDPSLSCENLATQMNTTSEVAWKSFLETTPPNTPVTISGLAVSHSIPANTWDRQPVHRTALRARRRGSKIRPRQQQGFPRPTTHHSELQVHRVSMS